MLKHHKFFGLLKHLYKLFIASVELFLLLFYFNKAFQKLSKGLFVVN
jgi:hypothetical protein